MINQQAKFNKLVTVITSLTVLINALLGVVKLYAGITASSYAMISDAVNSFADVVSSLIILIGVRISAKQADKNHPYGHERFECITALVLSFIMLISAFEVGKGAVTGRSDLIPGTLAVITAIATVIVKAVLFVTTIAIAKKASSSSLKVLAFDHVSDVVATLGGLVGILLSRAGYPIFDKISGVIICLFIAVSALGIFKNVVSKLTDEAVPKHVEAQIRAVILSDEGVSKIDLISTRQFGDRIYVDIEIAVRSDLSLITAHEIAERVHDKIESEMPAVKHCTVHVNPALSEEE